jgi:hypothetical protein
MAVGAIVLLYNGCYMVVRLLGDDPKSSVATVDSTGSKKGGLVAHRIGESFGVGYWSYRCNGVSRPGALATGYEVIEPRFSFILVDITVSNNDKTSSIIPEIRLMDQEGRLYDMETHGLYGVCFSPLESLNPDMPRRGLLAFDVPPDRNYVLLVSGGLTSKEQATVTFAEEGRVP